MKIQLNGLTLVVASLLASSVVPTASAQCTITYVSVEARVCTATSVYYGSIAGFKRKVIVPRNGTRKGGTSTIPDGVVQYVLTIKVDEFLKGPKSKKVRLVLETSDYDKRYDQWTAHRTKFLFFVTEPDKAHGRKPLDDKWPPPWTSLRLGKAAPAESTYKTRKAPIFAKDVTVLSKPAEIVARARQFMKRSPKVSKTHTFRIPRRTAELCSPSCDANFLVVPLDPALEQTAKELLHSPEDYVSGKRALDTLSSYVLRLAGVNALQHFKSAKNEKLLKSLLNDPTTTLTDRNFGKYKGKTLQTYPIRRKSWEILKSWKVKVTKPVTEEIVR